MLKLSQVSLGYNNKEILRFKGLDLPSKSQLLITGESGSGKTTLLYTIAGLIPALEGQVIINGTDISKLSESDRDQYRGKNIGIIFQTLHLIKSLNVLDNLLLAPYVSGSKPNKERALELLNMLNIGDKAHFFPEELSQGQSQRVAVARAVLQNPSLIIADEPTSSLDDSNCASVIALLKEIAAKTEATLVISTHDSRVKSHFDNVITL